MRKLILLLFYIALINNCYSQRQLVDSLSKLLTNEKTDTARVMILRDLVNVYRDLGEFDSAMRMVKQGWELSQKIHYKRGEAVMNNAKGTVLVDKGNRADALKLYIAALKINEELADHNGMSRNLNNIGIAYSGMEDYRTALSYFFRAVAAADEYNKHNSVRPFNSVALFNIVDCYIKLKAYDSASFYAQKMYDRGRATGDTKDMFGSMALMGVISKEKGDYKIALEYFRSYLNLIPPSGRYVYSGWSLMARIFEKMGEADSAIYYGKKAIPFFIKNQSLSEIADLGKLLSAVYTQEKNTDSSLHYLRIAMTAKDSLEQRGKTTEIANLLFNEKLKEEEKAEAVQKAKEERKRNLQYAAIALGLIAFLIFFFILSHSIIANQRLIKFLGILALLIVFEFINLFVHPYLDKWTDHSIPMMLAIMVCIAALLIPLHHKMEHWITHKLVEKNNRIRLAAAKKTILKLESEQTH